jgi:hypothetical protein
MNFHNWFTYQLAVRGSGTSGLIDQAGRPLDGDGDDHPGGDLLVNFRGYGRVLPKLTTAAEAKLVHSLRPQVSPHPK